MFNKSQAMAYDCSAIEPSAINQPLFEELATALGMNIGILKDDTSSIKESLIPAWWSSYLKNKILSTQSFYKLETDYLEQLKELKSKIRNLISSDFKDKVEESDDFFNKISRSSLDAKARGNLLQTSGNNLAEAGLYLSYLNFLKEVKARVDFESIQKDYEPKLAQAWAELQLAPEKERASKISKFDDLLTNGVRAIEKVNAQEKVNILKSSIAQKIEQITNYLTRRIQNYPEDAKNNFIQGHQDWINKFTTLPNDNDPKQVEKLEKIYENLSIREILEKLYAEQIIPTPQLSQRFALAYEKKLVDIWKQYETGSINTPDTFKLLDQAEKDRGLTISRMIADDLKSQIIRLTDEYNKNRNEPFYSEEIELIENWLFSVSTGIKGASVNLSEYDTHIRALQNICEFQKRFAEAYANNDGAALQILDANRQSCIENPYRTVSFDFESMDQQMQSLRSSPGYPR